MRSVARTNNKPTTDVVTLDYHHDRGEAKDATLLPYKRTNCRSSARQAKTGTTDLPFWTAFK